MIVVPLVLVVAAVVGIAALWNDHAMSTASYRGRDYINPSDISSADVTRHWAPLRDTHAKSHGLEVFVPAAEDVGNFSATVVLLRRGDGTFSIYELSGGP